MKTQWMIATILLAGGAWRAECQPVVTKGAGDQAKLGGPAAKRPANCVMGQVWVATDSGVLSYCAVSGSPGTWRTLATGGGGGGAVSGLCNVTFRPRRFLTRPRGAGAQLTGALPSRALLRFSQSQHNEIYFLLPIPLTLWHLAAPSASQYRHATEGCGGRLSSVRFGLLPGAPRTAERKPSDSDGHAGVTAATSTKPPQPTVKV